MNYLRDKFGRPIQTREMMAALGFRSGQHIPKDYESVTRVGDVFVYVLPSRGGSKHRVFYECPECDRLVPFGRVGQHLKGRKHRLEMLVCHPVP